MTACGQQPDGVPLRAATVADLPLPQPSYDRSQVTVGIVHLGVGGFHRAHEAVFVDRLLSAGATDWGICGVGTQPADRRMRDVLRAQDGLYTVLLKHPDGRIEPQVIGSLVEYLYAPDDPEEVVERLAAATTRLVSLTITEGGYLVDPLTGVFRPDEPAVQLDLQPGSQPTTVFGLVVEALARRRDRGTPPFTVLSCDNVPQNGEIARTAFSGFAALRDPELGEWVRSRVLFPSSMVDRITPATTDADRDLLASRFGVRDAWPVVCEPYLQWVLEDGSSAAGPAWEDVGVQVVEDVHPYELMKLRLLNAGHQALGYLGYLAGYRYTDEACGDPVLTGFLLDYMELEATPTLRPVPGVDLPAYSRSLLERFGNPAVRDALSRLCAESSDRIATFLLPVVREQLARGGDVRRSALVCAAWARYAEGVDEQGSPIEVVDRLLETVREAAAAQRDDPTAFLRQVGVFGELASDPVFSAAFVEHLRSLHEHGARATVERLVAAAR
ncbi:MAG: mannitol dehydrogenase-like protein [Frankiales bacterium]|nr:mannitol dehydrogenase-like protein [Frankiales bacterium]